MKPWRHRFCFPRAANIEYAIRDVVVPATELEAQGHEIIKLNIGDPIAYPGLPTPQHMVDAYVEALQGGKRLLSFLRLAAADEPSLEMSNARAGTPPKTMSTCATGSLKPRSYVCCSA